MNVIVSPDYEQLSIQAAAIIAQAIKQKPNLVLGLATGSTPQGTYQELIRLYLAEKISFKEIITFNLDEYVGLATDHSHSYHFFMWHQLFSHVDITPKNIFIPDGLTSDLNYGKGYEQKIKQHGGIDIQLLGIGSNGHIGFNEPGSLITSRTRTVALHSTTIHDNARFFDQNQEKVPTHAITMGIATILESRACLLLANGIHKADIIARALTGPITEAVPASFLQKHHNLTVLLDAKAAIKLSS